MSLLNDFQLAVLQQVAKGLTNEEIGKKVGKPRKTVENKLLAIYEILCARNRIHAVMLALAKGLISMPKLEELE
jgi:two-component system competent response regulator ComA